MKDLVPPAGTNDGLQHWTLIVAPQELLEPSKTYTYDDSIVLDHPPFLPLLLPELKLGRPGDELLFNIATSTLLSHWRQAVEELALPDAVLYQLRHAAASADILSKRRTPTEIMARGRWSTLASLKRYAKGGKAQQMMHALAPATKRYCLEVEANFEAIVLQRVAAYSPP